MSKINKGKQRTSPWFFLTLGVSWNLMMYGTIMNNVIGTEQMTIVQLLIHNKWLRNIVHHERVMIMTFQVTWKMNNQSWIIDYTKLPFALVKRQICDTLWKIVVNGCAYACTPHKVHVQWTQYQIIDWVNKVRWDSHKCMYSSREISHTLLLV